ncbi:MAG: type II toxin-antitoxin system RelE/ParE family toxin [Lachnospiraceae bacterium]|nr:type II toxin-antitoxin system RelE/ParE family toxin [Lachnospiraceae bacterium]
MASEKYDYVLTESAKADIFETIGYIEGDLSYPDAATDFLCEFEKKTDEICKTPKAGRLVENEFLKRNDVRRYLVDNYIAYSIMDDEARNIIILRLVYGKRNRDEILKNVR